MILLIHVAVSEEYAEAVKATLESCCEKTGDILIGQRVYDEVGEVLFVVRLMHNYFLTEHTTVLNQALQQNNILSFQSELTHLISIECTSMYPISEKMQGFPLQANESWFPSSTSSQKAYLCVRKPTLNPLQRMWLELRNLTYTGLELEQMLNFSNY
jgi:hypothetical protein